MRPSILAARRDIAITIYNADTNNTGSVLTLGPNVIVNQAINETIGYAELNSAGSNHAGDGIINQGTINAEAVNGSFYIEPYNFTNQGTINVSNGDKLYIEPSVGLTNAASGNISVTGAGSTLDFAGASGTMTNAGTITMAAGETLTLGSSTSALSNTGLISATGDTVNIYSFGGFSNTGTFNITNSAVNLYGSYTTAQLAVFASQGDTITIDGTLTNTGSTLTVGLGSALGTVVLPSGGTIVGGTIVDQGSGVLFQSGTLSGVTYDGTLDLSAYNSTVYIATGLTANNLAGTAPGTINLTGEYDYIYFEGNQTFNNATINLGSTSGYYDTIYNYDTSGTGSVLTLGPNVIVNQAINETSGYAELNSAGSNHAGDGIINQGTINAEAVNGSFYIEPYNFTNQGTINVSNGDKLYIEPSVGLTNAASGNISVTGAGSTLDFAGASGTTTNAGTITMAAGETLTLGSSTSALSNTGLISATGDTVNIYSFGGFSNTGTFNITNSAVNLYGSYTTAQLAVFASQGDTITIDGTLTNTGSTLTVGLGSALGTVVLPSGGTIVGGTIVDQGSGVLFQSGTLSGVTYDGTLDLSAYNSTVYIATSLTANNLAGTAPGTINLTGEYDYIYFEGNQTFNNATINLGSTSGYYDTIYNYDTSGTGSVLTLGPNVIVNQAINETSGYAELNSAGSNHAGDGIINQGTINAEAVNGSFYIEPYNFTNQGTINVSNGDKLYIEPTTFTNNGAIAISGGTVDITTSVAGTGNFTINAGTLELSASSPETVTFESGGGTLKLDNATSFIGEIKGITGSGEILDLAGYDASTTASTAGAYNATTNTTILTVTDPGHTTLEYTLAGNFSASTWTVTPDSTGTGVDIVDPPATNPLSGSTVISSVTSDGVSDTFTFADSDTSSSQKANFAPEGPNYIGTFSLGSVSESHGSASVEYDFMLGNDRINLAPGQTVTQSYDVSIADPQNPAANVKQTISVSIGGPGDDNFIFHPGIGADTMVNFNPQADTIELDKFANAQTVQQLTSLITTDAHGDAVIELGHNDSITIPGVTQAYLQAHLQSLVHLH